MRAAYVSFDEPNRNTGSGQVIIHETNALRQVCADLTVVTRRDIKGADQYEFSPWLYDYFGARLLPKNADLLDMHCSPGLAILDAVRPKRYCVSIIAHDLAVSIEEHERYYGKGTYGLKHNTDPYLHELLLKHAENADRILTPSTHSEKWIRANIKNDRIAVIPHGCEIPASVTPTPATLTFGYMGAAGADKGLIYLFMAWKYFEGGHLVFAGNQCDAIKGIAAAFSPMVDNAPMPAGRRNQVYMGWVKSTSDFYNGISVYIQPSATESWGIEVVEAMAHGRPAIVSAGAGSADAVTDGVDGFVVPSRDAKAILDKLVWFREHPEKIAEMGAAAREKAKQYSWAEVEKKYVKLYEELLKPS